MQIVWNSQKTEKLYAIDESALFKQIKKRGGKVGFLLNFFEGAMVFAGLIVVVTVLRQVLERGLDVMGIALGGVYLFVGLMGLFFRFDRGRRERAFDKSMMGELDRAIWRLDRVKFYGRTLLYWCLLPILVVVAGTFVWQEMYLAAVGYLVFIVAIYFGVKWEMRTFHQPNQDDLKSLKETLLAE